MTWKIEGVKSGDSCIYNTTVYGVNIDGDVTGMGSYGCRHAENKIGRCAEQNCPIKNEVTNELQGTHNAV